VKDSFLNFQKAATFFYWRWRRHKKCTVLKKWDPNEKQEIPKSAESSFVETRAQFLIEVSINLDFIVLTLAKIQTFYIFVKVNFSSRRTSNHWRHQSAVKHKTLTNRTNIPKWFLFSRQTKRLSFCLLQQCFIRLATGSY